MEPMGKKSHKKVPDNSIALNRKAHFDYHLEEKFDAGLVLEGWEVKSLRSGRAQIKEAYVILKRGEAFLVGALITPLPSASTHIHPDPTRSRKLLLHQRELSRLIGATQREGYTIVPLRLYFSKQRVKLQIALAKGKKQHDKREVIKKREWNIEKQRLIKPR